MKKILFISIALAALATTGCLKDVEGTDLNATGNPLIEFEYPAGGGGSAIGTGLEYFGGCALTYPSSDVSDTAVFYVNIASTNTLSSALSVTIGSDFKADLDNYSNDSIPYKNMPDSDYTIVSATQTIAAGQRQATFQIVFYPDKIDPTQSFALPITATSSGNIPVSGNFGHIYFHTIGNPLAGFYNSTGTRNNYNGSSGWSGTLPIPTPASINDLSGLSPKLSSPVSTTQVTIPYSNLGGSGDDYVVTWNGSYTVPAISVTANATLGGGVSNFKVEYETLTFDSNLKPTIFLVSSYTNGAGNDRINIETLVHQ